MFTSLGKFRIVKIGYLLPCILDVKHSHHHIAKHLLQDILSTASITIAFSTHTSVYRPQRTRSNKRGAETNPQESKNHVCASQLSFPPCHATPRHPSPPMLNSCKNIQTKLKRKPCMLAKQRKDFRLLFPMVVEGRGSFFSSEVAIIICQTWVSVSKPG